MTPYLSPAYMFLNFFTIKLLESYLHINLHFLDPVYSSILSNLAFIFTSPLKLHVIKELRISAISKNPSILSHGNIQHLSTLSVINYSFPLDFLITQTQTQTHMQTQTHTHTYSISIYQSFSGLSLVPFHLLYTFLLVCHSLHGINSIQDLNAIYKLKASKFMYPAQIAPLSSRFFHLTVYLAFLLGFLTSISNRTCPSIDLFHSICFSTSGNARWTSPSMSQLQPKLKVLPDTTFPHEIPWSNSPIRQSSSASKRASCVCLLVHLHCHFSWLDHHFMIWDQLCSNILSGLPASILVPPFSPFSILLAE